MSVNDEGDIVLGAMGNTIALTHNVTVNGNDYTFENPDFADVKVVVENDEITYICLTKGALLIEFEENGDSETLEAELAALMGDNMYASEDLKSFVKAGMVIFSEKGVDKPLKDIGQLTKTEDNYFYQLSDNINLVFVVEEGQVIVVQMLEGYSDVKAVLEKQDLIAQIAIGEETTKYYDTAGFLSAINAIEGVASVKLLDDIWPEYTATLYVSSTSDITLDLNGKDIYNSFIDISGKLTVDSSNEEVTGSIINDTTYPFEVREGAELTINGGNFWGSQYIYYGEGKVVLNGGYFSYGTIYTLSGSTILGEGKVLRLGDGTIITKITETITQSCKVIDDPSTPTAIESVEAEKVQKAVKTIENGRVVIKRGGLKFDLSGRKL